MFLRFGLNFAGIATARNIKLRKGQAQTFEGLSGEDVNALETIEAKLIELSVLVPLRSRDDYTVDTDQCNQADWQSLTTEETGRN